MILGNQLYCDNKEHSFNVILKDGKCPLCSKQVAGPFTPPKTGKDMDFIELVKYIDNVLMGYTGNNG